MENYNQNTPEEEIQNIDQFQISRSDTGNQEADEDEDYTADEVEYADGEGTQLNNELGETEEDDVNALPGEDEDLEDADTDDDLDLDDDISTDDDTENPDLDTDLSTDDDETDYSNLEDDEDDSKI
ncbi:hypothetical protein [Pedobacter mucosus]|uniref:hypothetical protein n=1 Tax=Pedobacter mucosus TaxID=2895286 RepID=UPI001EE4B8A4|nr:hypothetical protein [Pedobacter mucosus]UKT64653.1 hypothetical protein LOK61_02475 [Pedobacter mucosus]